MSSTQVVIRGAKFWEPLVRWAVGPDPKYGNLPVLTRSEQLVQFHLAWIQKESGGNPAAIGANGAKGPDGYPREIGLYQLYNPDDFAALKATPQELRAYCMNSLFRPEAEKLTRDLTPGEKVRQIELGVGLVKKCFTYANNQLTANHATGTWSPDAGPDFWRMTKLVHTLPGLVKSGLRATTKKLGRCPSTWGEFRTTLASVSEKDFADAGTWKYKGDWPRLLDNAQEVGGSVTGKTVS